MPQNDETQADGYYTEDAIGADELDLSFLDDDESPEEIPDGPKDDVKK